MPITVNEGGVLYDLETVTANENGVLYALDTVHSNEDGTLYEIYSGWNPPAKITWYSRSDAGYITSQTNNGYTVSFRSTINTDIINSSDYIEYCSIHTASSKETNDGAYFLKAGCNISVTVDKFSKNGGSFNYIETMIKKKSAGAQVAGINHISSKNSIVGSTINISVKEDDYYYIGIRAYGISSVSVGQPNYYSATVSVSISITRT